MILIFVKRISQIVSAISRTLILHLSFMIFLEPAGKDDQKLVKTNYISLGQESNSYFMISMDLCGKLRDRSFAGVVDLELKVNTEIMT